jgi:hypothetical protein
VDEVSRQVLVVAQGAHEVGDLARDVPGIVDEIAAVVHEVTQGAHEEGAHAHERAEIQRELPVLDRERGPPVHGLGALVRAPGDLGFVRAFSSGQRRLLEW